MLYKVLCLPRILSFLWLAWVSAGQDPYHKVTILEEQVANLTTMVDMMKTQLIHHKARLSALEECECRRKCFYKGVERQHNDGWIQDICTTCSCHDGQVTCRSLLDNPRCVGGCWVNNTLYGNNETFETDSCTSCVCRSGSVQCDTVQCPALLCRRKIKLTGQCCYQCLSCIDRGRVIPYGRAFRPNACTRCHCGDNAPSPTCTIQTCPNASCIGTPVKSRRQCCPACKDCPPHGNEEIWAVDDCTNCTCEEGEERCNKEICPSLHCTHPVGIRGHCCSTCERGCFFNGTLYSHDQRFDVDACTHCECQRGSAVCEMDVCPQLTCSKKFKRDGQCCEECPVCEVGDRHVGHNQLVMINACRRCLCFDGELTQCQNRQCRRLQCQLEAQYRLPGRCCNVCRQCDYEGRRFNHGETVIPRNDTCARCTCLSAVVTCAAVICPQACEHPAPSRNPCCPNCTACMYKSVLYNNTATFENPDDECSNCTCLNGTVTCTQRPCPQLSCDDLLYLDGSCCPFCAPQKCEIEGRTVNHRMTVQMLSNPCRLCICEDGRVTCQDEVCSVPCSHPLPPPVGQCCSDCNDGCLYQGRNYTSDSEFRVTDCTTCQCERGNVDCDTETCPPVSCRTSRKVDGECCPICQYCSFESRQYEDGDVFLAPSDPCNNCTCSATSVTCSLITCPNCTHPTPKTKGSCCHDCRNCLDRGRLIPNGRTFRPNSCMRCTCRDGNVRCNVQSCRPVTCKKTKSIRNQCCPVCQVCHYHGRIYDDGDQFASAENSCQVCECRGTEIVCHHVDCPVCTHPAVASTGHCCSNCSACQLGKVVYGDLSEFVHPSDPCLDCNCTSGNVSCIKRVCPDLSCRITSVPPGDCCPVCQVCRYGDRVYEDGDTFPSVTNRCDVCDCRVTEVHCQHVDCPSCTHPASLSSSCCTNCSVCELEGIVYGDLTEFVHPSDPCLDCNCRSGNVSCSRQECPDLSCRMSTVPPGGCCPVCQVCRYGDDVYEDGDSFLSADNPCRVCSCKVTEVLCNPVNCPSCTHSGPSSSASCCRNCSVCEVEGIVYEDQSEFVHPSDPCLSCTCRSGNVSCSRQACKTLSCRVTNVPDGACCPVCQVCQYGGNTYEDGDSFASQSNPCEVCDCRVDKVHCQHIACRACTHPAPSSSDSCCQNCSACELDDRVFESSVTFTHHSDPCLTCTCLSGSVSCVREACPGLSCKKSAVPPSECCPVCQVCTYDGVQYDDGDKFLPASNPCINCSCGGRSAVCSPLPCSVCSHPVPKRNRDCCDDCNRCRYEQKTYLNGTVFTARNDPCERCLCLDGNVTCETSQCPVLSCERPIVNPNHCCPECPPVCQYEGDEYEEDSRWTSKTNPCVQCRCRNGRARCRTTRCDTPHCSHPEQTQNECCPVCGAGCTFEKLNYSDGQTFYPGDDYCRECTCSKGNVLCHVEACPKLDCSIQAVLDGECCPRCKPCRHNGVARDHGEAWVSRDDPCLSFQCMDGVISHYLLRCADECNVLPIQQPGRCCSTCPPVNGMDGCKSSGNDYAVGEYFYLNGDPCVQCLCEEEGRLCYSIACPVQACYGEMIHFDEQCCPLCIEEPAPTPITVNPPTFLKGQCRFNGNIYNIGQTVNAYSDPCYNCTCEEPDHSVKDDAYSLYLNHVSAFGTSGDEGQVVCEVQTCPTLPCSEDEHVTVDGVCCKVCKYKACYRDGVEYQHGDLVSLDQYGCTGCICIDGELANCLDTPCPSLSCPIGTDLKLLEGECCADCIAVPPCEFDGETYQHAQQWRSRCRNYTCLNEEVTFSEQICLSLRCNENELPERKPSECCSRCVPKPATCVAFGDPHYKTFDGHLHHFQGVCNYILAQDCSNRDFSVLVENDARGHPGVSWTQEATFNRGNVSIDFVQGATIRANGRPVDLPFTFVPYVYVTQEDRNVVLRTDIGVTLSWDGNSILSVNVPSKYYSSMCGLCGNYNGNQFDEFQLRNGRITKDLNEFGNSWQIRRPGDKCEPKRGGQDPCQLRPKSHRDLAKSRCSEILGDAFKPCHTEVPYQPYFYSCMFDVCACTRSETQCLCSALESYANECTSHGVELRGRWRTGACAIQCPTERGLLYDDCGSPCRKTCDNYHQQIRCLQPCVTSCQCLAGLVEHNGYCVSPSSCPGL